jgi:predicted enzyme related to lactoylglutathione lyase
MAPLTPKPTNPRFEALGYDGGLTCSIHVSDLAKAVAWYSDVLGCQVIYKMDEMGWAELTSPIARVNIGLGQTEGYKACGPGIKLTFGVASADKARAALEAKKVRFDGPTMEIPGMVKLATFFDPDGNTLMFYEDLAKHHEAGKA